MYAAYQSTHVVYYKLQYKKIIMPPGIIVKRNTRRKSPWEKVTRANFYTAFCKGAWIYDI